jgi:(p)ppGpp synthase/HD superfamily hydrolase
MMNEAETHLTDRFLDAVRYAARVHSGQPRKGTHIPYLGHLLAVASLVIDAGGTEDEAIAALLHDAAEDQGGRRRLEDIRTHFGSRVADIVESCSDSLEEDPKKKAPWRERKQHYIDHLAAEDDISTYLISSADKLHNARSMLDDYRVVGDRLWSRFSRDGGRDRIVWNYRQLIGVYNAGPADPRRSSIVRRLTDVVDALETESAHGEESAHD